MIYGELEIVQPAAINSSDSGGLVPVTAFEPYVATQVEASNPKLVQLADGLTFQQVRS